MKTKITMRETGAVLDTNPEMDIEMKITSPIFSDVGTQTISDTLPLTPKNKRELSFPNHTDAANRGKALYPVIVSSGSFQRAGELYVTGCSDGISFNIGTNESIMYSRMKQKKLSELDGIPVYDPGVGDGLHAGIAAVVDYLHEAMYDPDAPVTVFQVVLSDDTLNNKRLLTLANQYQEPRNSTLIWEARSISQVINGEETLISVPDGYGVAPFPKIWKLLEIIFESFGLTVVENIFKSHFQLKLLTSLHNCMDGICIGKIDYRQILPDCAVGDFLDALHNKFGALFFVDSDDNSVKIKLLRDILAEASYKDYTQYKCSEPTWKNVDPKQIRLKFLTGLKNAKPPQGSYDEFVKSCNNIISSKTNFEGTNEGSVFDYSYLNNIYSLATGFYYKQFKFGNSVKRELLGSDFFDWDQKTKDIEYQEYASKDESVPLMYIPEISPEYAPYYIVGLKHLNTALKSSNAEDSEASDAKLSFLFYFATTSSYRRCIASLFPRDSYGNTIRSPEGLEYPISLTARSIFMNFWKEWDAVLRHASQEYELELRLGKAEIFNVETSQKILVDNQPYLPKEFNFTIDNLKNSKMTLCSLRLLEPYNTDEDHAIPKVEEQMYYWAFYDGFQDTGNAIAEYHGSGKPGVSSELFRTGTVPTVDDVPWSLPPTENDHKENKKINEKVYTGRVNIYFSGTNDYNYSVDFNYTCFNYPAPVPVVGDGSGTRP
ncbi:MAG: hypothetical protein LBC40_01885 [Dysgonamonadaceae bacterium]|jgi:hypothetical protein|nr:hypothetical protein [Dysgonamonadaceae bacterium]